MSALPERYQQYATYTAMQHGDVELHSDRDPVVYVPDAYGQMVPMRRSQLPAAVPRQAPRDLTPQPLIDPVAQRFIAGGVGVGAAGAGVGWGMGQMFAGVAMMGTSGLAILLGLLLASQALRRRPNVSIHQEIHQHARFGKNNVTM